MKASPEAVFAAIGTVINTVWIAVHCIWTKQKIRRLHKHVGMKP